MTRNVNGIAIKKDSFDILDNRDFRALTSNLTLPAQGVLWHLQPNEVSLLDDSVEVGANTTGFSGLDTSFVAIHGRLLSPTDIDHALQNAIVSEALAKLLTNGKDLSSLLNKKLRFKDHVVTIVGIIRSPAVQRAELFFPITLLSRKDLETTPAMCRFIASEITDVQPLKAEIVKFLEQRYGKENDFAVDSNEFRVEQAAKGFTLFRIIMGLIVGISVLVGGIGVMNVLLISVTERTVEIGIRKALGAKKRDILLQFLSESITISLFGSLLGLATGILGTMIVIPIIQSIVDLPGFLAVYTLNTLIIISIIAILVGIIFGTYPAMRAARLDPVEAIRRE